MMKTPLKLSSVFLEHAAVRIAEPENADAFEDMLRCAWETGREQWPDVALPDEDFVCHLAESLPEKFAGRPLAEVLEQLFCADLYLACACVRGVPRAVDRFEEEYLSALRKMLAGRKVLPPVIDEVCQILRINMLLGAVEGKPDLAGYRGQSKLLSWLLVIAARMASKSGGLIREVPAEERFFEAHPAPDEDPEFDLIRRRYRPQVLQAMRDAFATLTSTQRELLWLYYFKGLSTTKIALRYGKDQSTISRWLKEARMQVYKETKRLLQERLHVSSQELQSLLMALKGSFDLSLSTILSESSEDGGSG